MERKALLSLYWSESISEHDLKAVAEQYEQFVLQEDKLSQQTKTCEDFIGHSIQSLLAYGREYDAETVENLLMALQSVEEEILIELSRVRIKKRLYAFLMEQEAEVK